MNWKSRIEALLAVEGVTVETIATAMGVTVYAIREIRNGNTKSPRYESAAALLDLCKQYGIEDAA